jgi:2,4-dienoyl-CoA reductase-like NADH-dependent reductase (Old Yellow Enzyme family)/thioredoxin reductase
MYDNVFEPITIAGVTLRNRIVRTAHGTNLRFPSRDDPDSGLVAYHEARARGGVAMSILEGSSVHSTSALSQIPLQSDDVIWGYEQLGKAAHPHGMKLFQQLWHGGNTQPNAHPNGQAPWSASEVPNPRGERVPVAMTRSMIDEIVGAFAAAARRVRDGGLDGVEVHAAHGYLPAQFFSPSLNLRTDDYGGPLENRVRFCIEVLQAIRAEVGADFPVGVRISADEEYEGGMRPPEMVEVAKHLEPHIDFLNVSLSTPYRLYRTGSTMDDPLGYELPTTGIVTRAVNVPTIVTGRIHTIDHASRIIADGVADMVSMVKALIADPELVNKTREGRTAEVRPCIGSSQGCLGQEDGHVACVVNVAAGYEAEIPLRVAPTTNRRKVLVAGGGPAGLEAARTLALGGHEVYLAERTGGCGGQVAIAASAPHRADYDAITRWLEEEVQRLGVKLMLRTFVEPDLVSQLAPDAVIVATGSTPRRDGFQVMRPAHELKGVDLPHVYTSWDVLGFGGRANVGRDAVIYDDTGSYEAICVADKLLEAGCSVTVVSRFDRFPARVAGSTLKSDMSTAAARERLFADERFQFVSDTYLVEITEDDVETRVIHPTAKTTKRLAADTVVMIGYNHPNRELADALDGTGVPTYVVGDAAGSRSLRSAIKDATDLARSLVASPG